MEFAPALAFSVTPTTESLFLPLQGVPDETTSAHGIALASYRGGVGAPAGFIKNSEAVRQTMLEIFSSVCPRILFIHDKLFGRQKSFILM